MTKPLRETIWSMLATVVLAGRLLATIGCVIFTVCWLVFAVRYSLLNGWLWWALGSLLLLGVSTYLYSVLRVRYPSSSARWEE